MAEKQKNKPGDLKETKHKGWPQLGTPCCCDKESSPARTALIPLNDLITS
jgi:hypothetical protein